MDNMLYAVVDEGDEMEKEFANARPEESKHVDVPLNQLLVPGKNKAVEEVKAVDDNDGF